MECASVPPRSDRLKREILINGSQRETRVAILEDDRLVELLVDRPDHRRTVGDIYLGRVEAVLPGIQAAFVDIGQEKSAFLHASDLLEPDEDEDPSRRGRRGRTSEPARGCRRRSAGRTRKPGSGGPIGGDGPTPARAGQRRRRIGNGGETRQREISPRRALPNIQDILKKGQNLPVQVTKEPIGTKGCRVTAQISLPGRFLVYMPYASKVGVSRKIESREQRAKLREMVSKLLPKDAGGVIVRTVAEGVTEEHFRREIDSLLQLWQQDQPEEDLRAAGAGAAPAGDQPHPRASSATCSAPRWTRCTWTRRSSTTRSSSTSTRSIRSS